MKYDIIKTDNYLIIIGDTFIWEGDEPYFVAEKLVDGRYDVIQIDNVNDWDTSTQYKILAHLPLNGNRLENIPLLPQLEQEDDYLDGCEFEFVNGYNKAKEKYKWTDEDVIKIVEKSRETGLTAEYFLLSLSQPKYPISFEQGNEVDNKTYTSITRRNDGFTLWIGKYIY